MSAIALGDHHPVEIALLPGGAELVTLERRRGISHISLWRVSDGKCLAGHDFEYMNVNTLCRTMSSSQVALGLDQSVALLDVQNGSIEAQVELQSRPIRKIRSDPQGQHIGLVTDKQLVAIDASVMRVSQEIYHEGLQGVTCDLRGHDMAALVTSDEMNERDQRDHEESALVLWHLAERP